MYNEVILLLLRGITYNSGCQLCIGYQLKGKVLPINDKQAVDFPKRKKTISLSSMLSFNHLINILMNVVKKISIWTVLIFSFVPVLVQSCLGSYGFTVPVLVPWLWFILLDTRILVQGFQGIICIFLILVLVWFHYGSKSGGT